MIFLVFCLMISLVIATSFNTKDVLKNSITTKATFNLKSISKGSTFLSSIKPINNQEILNIKKTTKTPTINQKKQNNCQDSDSQSNNERFIKGTTTGNGRLLIGSSKDSNKRISFTDTCNSETQVKEYYCMPTGDINFRLVNCNSNEKCQDGACKQEYFVSMLGNNNNLGSFESPFRDIQFAINNVPSGSIIHINEGRFTEQLSINKDITLIGKSTDETFIVNGIQSDTEAIIKIQNAKVYLKDLSLSGNEESYFVEATRGIYTENSELNLENIFFYAINNYIITVIDTNFHFKNINFIASEFQGRFIANTDVGIDIGQSSGIIDGLETGHFIDHIIDHDGSVRVIRDGNSKDLPFNGPSSITIKNSILRGRDFNWGHCIRYEGDERNSLKVFNTAFVGFENLNQDYPSKEELNRDTIGDYRWAPIAVSIIGPNIEFYNNQIINFPIGLLISGSGNEVKVYGNEFNNNVIAIETIGENSQDIIDLGGGKKRSSGRNVFINNQLFNIFNGIQANISAFNNNWGSNNEQLINEMIYDSRDDEYVGLVNYNSLKRLN